jgi:HK97 family phage portal protein
MSIWNPRTWGRNRAAIEVVQEGVMLPDESKASAAGPIISHHTVGLPVWTPRDYGNLAKESYNLNAIAFRCIKMIATASSGVDLCLYGRGGVEIETHPLLDLLKRPAPMIGGVQMREALFGYLLISGNTYLEAVGPDRKPPRELWVQAPQRMKVVPGAFGIPQAYEFEFMGRRLRWDVDPLTGQGAIMHVKEFNPLDDWYGLSRVETAAIAVDRHNSASAHNKALLDNGARPSGALVFEPIKQGDQAVSAPPDVIRAAERELTARHGGPKNAGKPMILGGSVQWLEMGMNMVDMDFGEGKLDAARDICTAFGVPHMLIVPGQSTYNNMAEAKLALYEETILPLVGLVVSGLNEWLCPKFGEGLELKPDLDDITALEPRRESKRKTTQELLTAGVIDADEARAALDYGPREPGAVQKVDPSVLTALVGVIPTVGLQPLIRYMKSVALFDASMSEDAIVAAALALIESDNTPPEDTVAGDQNDTIPGEDPAAQDTADAQDA